MRHESHFRHACKMVLRNFRSYAMLSITIVFSFAILLGYLIFADSSIYNSYKEIFASPREIVMAYTYENSGEISILEKQISDRIPSASSYRFLETDTVLKQYDSVRATISILPNNASFVFRDISDENIQENYTTNVDVIMGEGFPLSSNKAIINESFFQSISSNGQLPMKLSIPVSLADGAHVVWETEVVGVCEDIGEGPLHYDKDGHLAGNTRIYVSQSILSGADASELLNARSVILFNSSQPEEVAACAQKFDLVLHAVCLAQNAATEKIQAQTQVKFLITVVLYILLSINLFGCFSNALSDRRFEIGVKRAIGASAFSVIGQFLLESIIVMLCSTLLAVAITADTLAVYKLYQHFALGNTWTVSASTGSVLMFAVCSLSLTLVFSLFFAYRATKVEIVKYLKAE